MLAHSNQFWSFTIYDNQTRSFLETDQKLAGLDSTLPAMKKNADGYMHQFTVDSDFGVFEVTGDIALRKLVREIYAIAALQQIKGTDAFAAAGKDAATAPVALGKNLITNPADTVTGIPKGVYRLFSNIGTSATSTRDPSEDSQLETALLLSTYKREYAAQLGDVAGPHPGERSGSVIIQDYPSGE